MSRIDWLNHHLSLWSAWQMRHMCKVLILVKIKHKRDSFHDWYLFQDLSKCTLSWRPKMEVCNRASCFCMFFTKSGTTIVQELINCHGKWSKMLTKQWVTFKITIFHAGLGTATLILAKRWSHQVQLRDARVFYCCASLRCIACHLQIGNPHCIKCAF